MLAKPGDILQDQWPFYFTFLPPPCVCYIKETGIEKSKVYKTLNNEQVKSKQETQIANFLFMNGIKF